MKKLIFLGGLILLLTMILIGYLWETAMDRLDKEQEILESNLGWKIVLEKDTLTIVDYSFIDATYTLSDGRKISTALADSSNTFKP
jgi:type II secretory pathway component PulM